MDAKDPSTRRHSERVAALCEEIAEALGWSPERAALLGDAGLVHDVGKIVVPDAILFKPGPSPTSGPWSRSTRWAPGSSPRRSPRSRFLGTVHHEHWDGGGYPEGLLAEGFPEGARIMALADAWDVMTSERPTPAPRDPRPRAGRVPGLRGRTVLAARGRGAGPRAGRRVTPGRRLALVAAGVAGLAVAGLLGLALALSDGGDRARPSLRVVVEDQSAVATVPSRPPAPAPARTGAPARGGAAQPAPRARPRRPPPRVSSSSRRPPARRRPPRRGSRRRGGRARSSPRRKTGVTTPPVAVVGGGPAAPVNVPVATPDPPAPPIVAPVAAPPVTEPPAESRSPRWRSPRWRSPPVQ